LPLVGVGGVLPGGEFGVEEVEVLDAPVEALSFPPNRGDFSMMDGSPSQWQAFSSHRRFRW